MKPIIFNTEMVKAILDGRKTQTRRVINYGLYIDYTDTMNEHSVEFAKNYCDLDDCSKDIKETFIKYHGKYKVDDVLYVKETWCYGSIVGDDDDFGNIECWLEQLESDIDKEKIFYKADMEDAVKQEVSFEDVVWKPSIHMPKKYARIFLRVINVRIERLQDISEDDLEKEGIVSYSEKWENMECKCTKNNRCQRYCDRRVDFISLWNSTAKDGYKWEDNPYVFVYEFEIVDLK